jgi:hypothetical protein
MNLTPCGRALICANKVCCLLAVMVVANEDHNDGDGIAHGTPKAML